jgi:hypothetical protein
MLKIEQLRAEVLDRFERVDRRFAQQDQRLGRIDQRTAETADRLEAVRLELLDRLEALTRAVGTDGRPDDFEPTEPPTTSAQPPS